MGKLDMVNYKDRLFQRTLSACPYKYSERTEGVMEKKECVREAASRGTPRP